MLYVTNLVDHGGLDVACFEIDIVISASKVFLLELLQLVIP